MNYAFNNIIQSIRRMKVPRELDCILITQNDHEWLVEKVHESHPNMRIAWTGDLVLESLEGVPVRVFSEKDDMTYEISQRITDGSRFAMIYNRNTFIHSPSEQL